MTNIQTFQNIDYGNSQNPEDVDASIDTITNCAIQRYDSDDAEPAAEVLFSRTLIREQGRLVVQEGPTNFVNLSLLKSLMQGIETQISPVNITLYDAKKDVNSRTTALCRKCTLKALCLANLDRQYRS